MFSSFAVAGPHGASTHHSTDAEVHGLTEGLLADSLPKTYTHIESRVFLQKKGGKNNL